MIHSFEYIQYDNTLKEVCRRLGIETQRRVSLLGRNLKGLHWGGNILAIFLKTCRHLPQGPEEKLSGKTNAEHLHLNVLHLSWSYKPHLLISETLWILGWIILGWIIRLRGSILCTVGYSGASPSSPLPARMQQHLV